MSPERIYRNESGKYDESELAVLVWTNPNLSDRPNSRPMATVTGKSSSNPIAYPIRHLRFSRIHVSTAESVSDDIQSSTQDSPVGIPLPIARSHLGWTEFFIPTRYMEPR